MRSARFLAIAMMTMVLGCHGSKARETESGPPQVTPQPVSSEQKNPSESFLARLDGMSSARHMLKRQPADPAQMVFALLLDPDQKIAAGPRETAGFRFRTQPWTEGTPGQPNELVSLAATLTADDARLFVMAVRLTDKKADLSQVNPLIDAGSGVSGSESVQLDKVQVMVVRKQQDAPSKTGRLLAAKLWNLVGESINVAYAPAVLEGVVLGTRLKRNTSPPSFSEPGRGTWTLFRIVDPGEAYLALDWEAGLGEFFPKAPGVRSEAGLALFKAF